MSIKSFLAKPFAGVVSKQVQKWSAEAGRAQEFVFQKLIQQGKNTAFGKEHGFDSIHSHQDFAAQVPVRDYEQLSNWIEKNKSRRRKYFVERQATLLRQNIRHHLRCEIHSHHARLNSESYQHHAECVADVPASNRQ